MKKPNEFLDSKLIKFLIVGVVNTIAGTVIMFGLYNLGGFNYWVSSAANYIIASILSYFLNKYFTFQNKQNSWRQVVRFIINILACYMIAYGIAKPLVRWALSGMVQTVQENAAMFIGMCLFTGLNYIGQRYFAFREN